MLSIHWNWQRLFSYAEVVCFVSAWAVGLLIAMQEQQPVATRLATHALDTSDTFGIQATLTR